MPNIFFISLADASFPFDLSKFSIFLFHPNFFTKNISAFETLKSDAQQEMTFCSHNL